MSDSSFDYKAEIQRLMKELTAEAPTESAESVSPPPSRAVHLSAQPSATPVEDLPFILEDVPYDPNDVDRMPTEDVELLTFEENVSDEAHKDDFENQILICGEELPPLDGTGNTRPAAPRDGFFRRRFFRRGDSAAATARKAVFWLLTVLVVFALVCGVYVLGVHPLIDAYRRQQLSDSYDPSVSGPVSSSDGDYPQGMLASFRELYDINSDVCGYIRYSLDADKSSMNIDVPVVYAGDNTTYWNQDFSGNPSNDGTPFLDERCGEVGARLRIVYGKNATSGGMFAGLNSLVGSVYNARAAATLTYSTLYEESEYRVFAVVLTDESATGARYFDSCRTVFDSDEAFEQHIGAVMERSLFDYGVEVTAEDDVLVLVTDASVSVAKIDNARLAVYARRVRDNEPYALIVKNEDVLMPYAWYAAMGLAPHVSYRGEPTATARPTQAPTEAPTSVGTTSTTQADATTTTTTTGGDDSSTAETGQNDGVIDMG